MKRLFMGVVWFVVFWIGGSFVVGAAFGAVAGARYSGDPEAAAEVGAQVGRELGEKYGGLFLVLVACAAVGGTVTGVLPGTEKEQRWR